MRKTLTPSVNAFASALVLLRLRRDASMTRVIEVEDARLMLARLIGDGRWVSMVRRELTTLRWKNTIYSTTSSLA